MAKKLIAIFLAVFLLCSLTVSAKEVTYAPYKGYEFNSSDESVAAPVGYIQNKVIDSEYLKLETALSAPTDMLYKDGKIYLLDSGNSRVLILNSDFSVSAIRENFKGSDGSPITFEGAQGLEIDGNGNAYIADTEMNRILIFNKENKLTKEITRPDSALLDTGFPFRVTKVKIDRQGTLLAIAESVNAGAFRFDSEGEFLDFFGRNTVVRTADVLLNYLYKKILTREQIKQLQNFTPRIILNMDIDKDGFIYLVDSSNTDTGASAVRKLNYKGSNIFESDGVLDTFGDLEWDREEVEKSYTNFGDIDVSDEGFINLLDIGRKKVFQYTQEGQLIAVFGGSGTQYGTFTTPSAIETVGENIYVLDSSENCIFSFAPTEYAKALQEAFLLSDTDDADKAITAWENVLKLNTNSLYPYYGLGLVYENMDDYKTAMEMFKISHSKNEYSNVYREYRQIYLNQNAWWLLLVAAAVIVLIAVAIKLLKKKYAVSKGVAFSAMETKYLFPLYTLFHPVDGFEQFKWRNGLTSWRLSFGIIFAWFVLSVTTFFRTGFIFNNSDPNDYNILVSLIGSALLYVLFVACNWGIGSLFDGSGKLKEIASVTAYALIPYIVSQAIRLILTQVLVAEEALFLTIVTVIGVIWSFILLFGGLYAIHQYSVSKTIANLLLTLFGMAVVVLIIILFFTLMQQVVFFVQTIAEEWRLR